MKIIESDSKNKIDWGKISSMKIFFGHMSVGNNIIHGIRNLNSLNKTNRIDFVTLDSINLKTSYFAHCNIGKNKLPFTKIDDFTSLIENKLGNEVDIAFFKFCYTDIRVYTDIDSLFEHYRTQMNYLKDKYPETKFVHMTCPLMTKPKGVKGLIKRITGYDHNKAREKYNNFIRSEYNESDIFDIARIESTNPDGKVVVYGNKIRALSLLYTVDGGHLNQLGSQVVALEMLRFISEF